MTKDKMKEMMENLQKYEMQMREEGQKEYAHDDDNAFANFERVAEQTGMTREQVLMVYLLKHIDGISSYVKGHRSQREGIQGRIIDARVYLALLAGMVEGTVFTDCVFEFGDPKRVEEIIEELDSET